MALQRTTYLLEYLIPSLSLQEVRDLRSRLAQVEFRLDILAAVPAETRVLICLALDATDIWTCLTVSKKWRTILLSDPVRRKLSRTWFPGLLETADLKGVSAEELFVSAARHYAFRATGKFRSVLYRRPLVADEIYFHLDPSLHLPPKDISPADGGEARHPYAHILARAPSSSAGRTTVGIRSIKYSTGRIAWQYWAEDAIDGSLIIVDDFRTGLRKVLKPPSTLLRPGVKCYLSAVGDKLITANRGRELLAWELDTNKLETIYLPYSGRNAIVLTKGLRVAITNDMNTSDGDTSSNIEGFLYLWEFGGRLLELPLDEAQAQNLKLAPISPENGHRKTSTWHEMFLHPHQDKVVYLCVVTGQIGPPCTRAVVIVHRFEGRRYCGQVSYNLTPHLACLDPGTWVRVLAQEVNSYGQYQLATFGTRNREDTASDDCLDCSTNSYLRELSVSFNVYTSEFTVDCYHPWMKHYPPRPNESVFGHRWNDQLTIWRHGVRARGAEVDRWGDLTHPDQLLLTKNICTRSDHLPGQDADVPAFTSSKRPNEAVERRQVLEGPWRASSNFHRCGLAYALVPDGEENMEWERISYRAKVRALTAGIESIRPAAIEGDDDFLLFSHQNGYTVWAFNHDLPSSEGAEDTEKNTLI